jgi:beta-glucosidase
VGQIPLNFPNKPNSQSGQPSKGPNGFGKTRVNDALYPFGYGLSYTSFQYDNLKISSQNLEAKGNLKLSFSITNTGKYIGDEIPQLYVNDEVSSVVTYERVLRGFERITLKPGETKQVEFIIRPKDLTLLDKDMNEIAEAGLYNFYIGSSSIDFKLKGVFKIESDILIE